MIKVVAIRFRTAGKSYYFDPEDLDIKRGTNVIVETAQGKDATDAEGNVNGVQIQPTNKAFYEWLERWPVTYDREWTYEDWEFEGAE